MHFRRSAAVAVAAAALFSAGCAELDDRGKPQNVAVAVFDPSKSLIPLPNDLALGSIPNAAVAAGCPGAVLPDAKSQFLCGLKASGGFPNDQEVSISFAFQRQSVDDVGALHAEPAVLDTTTVRVLGVSAPAQATVAVFDVTGAPTTTPTSVLVQASYDAPTGTLKLRKLPAADGSRRWIGDHKYAVFVRGGPSGVKTVGGGTVEPMPTMFVLREAIVSDKSLTDPDNQTLLPGTAEQKAAAGAQLEQIRQGYRSLRSLFFQAFGGASFGEMVNMLTFTVAPYPGVVVEVDPTKGSAPLPIDLLRAPDAAGGLIQDNPAYGSARSGMVTLDGFSTTAPLTAPVTGSVATLDAATIGTASGNVLVYDLSTNPPTLLKEFNQELQTGGAAAARTAGFIAQPPGTFIPPGTGLCPRTNLAGAPIGGCASSIVLQPAVPISAVGAYLPPLKGGTKYGVVITKRVKDILGNPLARSTAAKIILDLTYPVDASIGVEAGVAALLQQMRTDLAPVFANLPAGTTKNDVAMAYVFKTQTVPTVSLQLSAAPYGIEAAAGRAVFTPQAVTTVTGSYPQVAGAADVYEVLFTSVDATSKVNGALDPSALASAASHLTLLKAVVAVPDPTLVPTTCPAPANALKCAPLVVFGHGLRGHKGNLLVRPAGTPASVDPTVNALLARGFAVAAIDFPQHGERTWCLANSDCDLSAPGAGDGTCTKFTTPTGAPSLMGDVDSSGVPTAPGVCTGGSTPNLARSGQTFISSNFFRIRDAFRQNLLDQSALVLALARPAPTTDAFTSRLAAHGVAVDPSKVYWEGISLGGIAGTEVLATNPRFSRGVTSVAGGTLVDVFTKAPAFQVQVNALFTSLLKAQLDTIAPGQPFDQAFVDPSNASSFAPVVAAQYGKTLLLAKWILDPGDALNYAKHLRTAPLPNLLANPNGTVLQSQKAVLGQVAVGDLVIPNDFNRQLFRNGGIDVVEYTSNAYAAAQMHGVLSFDATVQDHAAAYLADPIANLPPAPPTQVTIP